MITYIQDGDIFASKATCLVNPVNCMGVMGKGLALEFKHQWPGMFDMYKSWCKEGLLGLGKVGFYITKTEPKTIICLFPTKIDWRKPSTITIIDLSIQSFNKNLHIVTEKTGQEIKSVAFPKVGCGLGGLSFENQVKPLLEKYFVTSPLKVELYI